MGPPVTKKRWGIRLVLAIPIILILLGIGIVSLAGWELTKQTAILAHTVAVDYKPELPPKKFEGLYTERPEPGAVIGTTIIDSINLKYPIIQGTLEEHLERGIGHYAGSVLPGENGNVIITGHRDTVFRNLGKVKMGDLITLKTKFGTYIYRAKRVRIVDKEDRTVIVPSDKEMLTISTCYPFRYVGKAPKRYILLADFVRKV